MAQTAAVLVLSPIFEADFDDAMYGYRPRRSAQDAVRVVDAALREGCTDVVDADLSKYFDTIPHADLMRSVARRVSDGKVLRLLRLCLRAPVEERDADGRRRRTRGLGHTEGTPRGGVVSPLLANVYFHRFLRAWRERGAGEKLRARVVNYADDFVILCKGTAPEALALARRWMTSLKLTLNEAKTTVRDARRETFDFLGYNFGPQWHRPSGRQYLAVTPSRKSVAGLRVRVREAFQREVVSPWDEVVAAVNRVLRGWANYFSYGQVTRSYWWVDAFVLARARGYLARRHEVYGRGTRRFPRSAPATAPTLDSTGPHCSVPAAGGRGQGRRSAGPGLPGPTSWDRTDRFASGIGMRERTSGMSHESECVRRCAPPVIAHS